MQWKQSFRTWMTKVSSLTDVARPWICSVLIALASLAGSQLALANVITAQLDWRAESIEAGLNRVKDQFLDASIREDAEYVGAVLRDPAGSITFTQGNGEPGQDRVTFRIQRPSDTELVGLWHTHGAHGPTRAVFSPTDAALVRQTGLPFYLITPQGEIRVLRPEHVEGRQTGTRVEGSLSRLPRGSHPGERLRGRMASNLAPRGCSDVMEV